MTLIGHITELINNIGIDIKSLKKPTWLDLVIRPSVVHSVVVGGTIRKHSKVGFADVYRFDPNPYVAENDAFYEDVNLTILIVKRG